MSALTRRYAASPAADISSKKAHGLWQEAITIQREWLDHGLSTQPADRLTAEHSLTKIYARISRSRPHFEWVSSPAKALPLVDGWPTLAELYARDRDPHPRGKPPLVSDLAMATSRMHNALGAGLAYADPELSPARKGKTKEPWPELPPVRALQEGVPFGVVLHRGIRVALHRSLAHGFRAPVRAALAGSQDQVPDQARMPACWYGQQEAAWIAYYDALRRLGLAGYDPDAAAHLGDWAAISRSCGWWWPGEEVCVVVDRPEMVRTEPFPGSWHDEVRIQPGGVRYRDGWQPLMP